MTTESSLIASISDVENMESIPLSRRSLANSTYTVFQRSAARHPKKTALRFLFSGRPDEKSFAYDYTALLANITQAANAFTLLGIEADDVVSVLLPNLPQNHFALWGAQAAGIANPINPMLEPEHIIEIMNAAKTRILVTLAPQPKMNLWEKTQHIIQHVPSLKTVLTVDIAQFAGGENNPSAALPGAENLKVSIEDFDILRVRCNHKALDSKREISPDSIACYFHTGGTTGAPKLAVQSHLNQVFSAWMVGQQLQWTETDVMHCGLPLFHVNAPLISGLAPFTVGGEVLLTSPLGFRSETVIMNFWRLIEQYKISFFMAVPAVYMALSKTWRPDINTSSLKFAACGAAPLPLALMQDFETRTGIPLLEGYGLTEGTVFSTVNPPFGKKRAGSIGIRIPYQAMKVAQLNEDGEYTGDCKADEVGTLVIKGPNVFQGYLRESDNKNIWIADGWLNTGDLGRQDAEGFFWLTGRSKDLIIRGGHNIDPRLIEEALSKHPAVAMAAAIGKPDAKMGEIPAAYVVLHEHATITEHELKKFAAEHISEHVATPKSIYIIDKMPLTAVGKIYKPALRLDAVKRTLREKLTTLGETGEQCLVEVNPDAVQGLKATIKLPSRNYSAEAVDKIVSLLSFFKIQVEVIAVQD